MKTQTQQIIRDMLAGRIGWLSDAIRKGPENAANLANELATLSDALSDLLTPPAAPAAPTIDTVRGPELYRTILKDKQTLDDLAQHLTQSLSKTHPFVQFVKQVRAATFDPFGTVGAAPIVQPVAANASQVAPGA